MHRHTNNYLKPRDRAAFTESLSFISVGHARASLQHSTFCDRCGKIGLRSKTLARIHIGLLLHTRSFLKPGSFALTPYPCRFGHGWHIGRDPAVLGIDFAFRTIPKLMGTLS